MFGMVEADVTETARKIADLRKQHKVIISLHIYTLYCLSRALTDYPQLNTYRRGKRLITFDDIDVGTTVEKKLPGTDIRYAAAFVVRAAQSMGLARLNYEMRKMIRRDPAQDETAAIRRKFARLPGFVRWLIGKRVKADPFMFRKIYGTVGLTSLHLADVGQPYFAVPPNAYTLTVATGGLIDRYVMGPDGIAQKRKFMPVTMAVDHAIVDGLLACRMGRNLVHRLQQGDGLDEDFARQFRELQEFAH
jgi:hypothetical protein